MRSLAPVVIRAYIESIRKCDIVFVCVCAIYMYKEVCDIVFGIVFMSVRSLVCVRVRYIVVCVCVVLCVRKY